MDIKEIKNIEREPGHIYYRRTYHGDAIIALHNNTVELPIQFTLEMDPMGKMTVELNLKGEIHYPTLPIYKALKEFIIEMDKKDELLC